MLDLSVEKTSVVFTSCLNVISSFLQFRDNEKRTKLFAMVVIQRLFFYDFYAEVGNLVDFQSGSV